MRFTGSRRTLAPSIKSLLFLILIFTALGFTFLTLRPVDPSTEAHALKFKFPESKSSSNSDKQQGEAGYWRSHTSRPKGGYNDSIFVVGQAEDSSLRWANNNRFERKGGGGARETKSASCAAVEEMGELFRDDGSWKESIRVRKLIQRHFEINGASRVQALSPQQFCRHGFIIAKASEAGFGNEMYKILTAAALSVMLNRSLIIGQTRGKYPFGDYISYTDAALSLKEVKHLWRKNGCMSKYGRDLVVRIDDFQKPARTNILCSNWRKWTEPIIWIQNTTDAVAAQFFLKNVNPEMRNAASELFGKPELIQTRPNVFGELMRVLISPSHTVEAAVKSVLHGNDPDMSLHMRMLMSRSVRAARAAVRCVRKAMSSLPHGSKRKLVLVSDNPSFIRKIRPVLDEFAEVIHFDYEHYQGNVSNDPDKSTTLGFRVKDWGPAPRWVAFVDFFLASRAKHAVISGAHRRVGTTYAQLIAALAAAYNLGEDTTTVPKFSFLSSFQSHLLGNGLGNQIGWGHVWNRFAGPLSCRNQTDQCALTPLLPPAWWDGIWQSPLPRDIQRLEAYGVLVSGLGTVDEDHLLSFCGAKKTSVTRVPVSSM